MTATAPARIPRPPAMRRCQCNGCLTLPERISPVMIRYWCPHAEPIGQVDIERHLAWQRLNKIPDWLRKVRRVPVALP